MKTPPKNSNKGNIKNLKKNSSGKLNIPSTDVNDRSKQNMNIESNSNGK